MSFSAHKLYGPKGIGALYIKFLKTPGMQLTSQIQGGGQQGGLRAGTLATHQIVGMGEAFRLAEHYLQEDNKRINAFREKLNSKLKLIKDLRVNGHPVHSIGNIVNICFEKVDKERLQLAFQRFAFSSSAACAADSQDTSHVLRAMGLKSEFAHRSIRFSFGRFTTAKEIDELISTIEKLLDSTEVYEEGKNT